MKRLVVLLLALFLAVTPALAARRIVLHASGPETSTDFGAEVSTRGAETLYINVYLTGTSGTITDLEMFLQSTMDGANWADVICDVSFKSTGVAPQTGTLNTREFIDETTGQPNEQYSATCKPGGGTVRLRWIIIGTSPSQTFSAYAIVR